MNSGYLPLIIGLLYLVIHIASIVAKEAAKRKEREKKMEQAERRRMTEARLEVPPPGAERGEVKTIAWESPQVLSQTPPTTRSGRQLDDLAVRRKQQLEQLRARQIGGPSQQTRTTQFPRREAPAAPPAEVPQQRRVAPPDRDRLRREAKIRAEQQARTTRQHPAQLAALSNKEAERADSRQRRMDSASLDVVGDTQAPRSVPIQEHKASPIILARIRDRRALREIFVLKELIDPPLALRDRPT